MNGRRCHTYTQNGILFSHERVKFCYLQQHGWTEGTAAAAKLLQSCPTLCDPIDGSPPGSSVPGILQAGTLEWVAISFCLEGVTLSEIRETHILCIIYIRNLNTTTSDSKAD